MNAIVGADQFTLMEWAAEGERLRDRVETLEWELGDWLLRGCAQGGEDAMRKAKEIFRRDGRRPEIISETCKAFPPERRDLSIGFNHYVHLRKLDPQEADRILSDIRIGQTVEMTRGAAKNVVEAKQSGLNLPDDGGRDPVDDGYRLIIQAYLGIAVKVRGITGHQVREARKFAVEAIVDADYGKVDL